MGQIKDITGNKYGKLTVLKHTGRKRIMMWTCRCECGRTRDFRGGDLKIGKIKSCGCSRYDILSVRNTKHGMHGTRIYRIWRGIISRCEIKSATSYGNYGGRGISVCPEWHSFKSFHAWALSTGYTDVLTIERIDVNGNYEPLNCTWIPKSQQAKNSRPRKSMPQRNLLGQFVKAITTCKIK